MILIILLSIAIFQGIVLGVIILKSPIFKSKANKYLAFAIFSLSFSLLNLVLEISGSYDILPILRIVDILDSAFPFPLFICLFVANQLKPPVKNSKYLKGLFILIGYSVITSIFNDLELITKAYDDSVLFTIITAFLNLLMFLILFLFIPGILAYTYSLIRFSKDKEEKKWLTLIWTLVTILLVSWLTAIFIGILFDYDLSYPMKIISVFAVFLIHWTSYFGVFKFRLAKDKEEIKALLHKLKPTKATQIITEVAPVEVTNDKKTELLTKENPYFRKLEELCSYNHIYRDSTIDRDKVATMLSISSGYVSQLVNTITGDNFSTYINRHRVEAVKSLIVDAEFDNYSLLAIGLECGFSSKSTFHTAFKKITGTTPNAYRKTQK